MIGTVNHSGPQPSAEAQGGVGWVRVKLTSPDAAAPTEGELVLRADRARLEPDTVTFLVGDEVVFRMERRFLRKIAWLVEKHPLGEFVVLRRNQYANSGRQWTTDDHRLLARLVAQGADLNTIANRLQRPPNAVRSAIAGKRRAPAGDAADIG